MLVTAQNSTTTQSYRVWVFRAGGSNANLSNLAISSGTLSPSFASGILSYTATVPSAVGSITVTPTLADSSATVKINGTTVANGTASGAVSLNSGNNLIPIIVTAQDGITTQTYTVNVARAITTTTTALGASGNPSVFGQSVTFTASVTGSSPTGTVTFNDGATALCTSVALSSGQAQCATSALAVGSHSITGSYAGDANNAGSTSAVLTQNVTGGGDFPLGGAIPPGWIQPSGSNAAWVVANDTTYAGSLSLKSGLIGHSQKSEISYTANFSAGTVSFARRVSSEPNFDFLEFYIDGVLQNRWSGEVAWSVVSFPISAGTHTLLWRYVKDGSVSSGRDAAWIDSVQLPGTQPVRFPLESILMLLF